MTYHPFKLSDLHTATWWDDEMAYANELIAPYDGVPLDELEPRDTNELLHLCLNAVGRMMTIQRALAVEKPKRPRPSTESTPLPKRRGRPPKEPQNFLAIVGQETSQVIHYGSTVMSADEARFLARQLLAAAEVMDNAQPHELETGTA